MPKVEIKKIAIKIGEKELSLTIDETKDLQQVLDDTLGNKDVVYIPSSPVIIERPYMLWPRRPYWEITWNDTSSIPFPKSDLIISCNHEASTLES